VTRIRKWRGVAIADPRAGSGAISRVAKAGETISNTIDVVEVDFAGAVDLVLPVVAEFLNRQLLIVDRSGSASTNNITVTCASAGGVTDAFQDGLTSTVISADYGALILHPDLTDDRWHITAFAFGAPSLRVGGVDDYTEIEADGTIHMVGDATVWDDVNFIALGLTPGASAPGTTTLAATSILVATFAGTGVTVQAAHGGEEIPHGYKEGTDIIPHVHWMPTTADAGNVKWYLEYWIRRGTGTITTGTAPGVGAATGTAWDEVRTDLTAISGTNITIGCQCAFRLYRDPADAADTYAAAAAALTVGVHYEIDTIGSRTVGTK